MRSAHQVLALWTLVASLAIVVKARPAAEPVGPQLRQLASRASSPSAWPRLRSYALSQRGKEERGLAFLTLGYQEYEAEQYSAAATDLAQAVETQFSLVDIAEYFAAASTDEAGDPKRAAELLDGFSSRHPESPWHHDAVALLAKALIEANEPERAIQALAVEPRAHERADLALLLAQAFRQAQRLPEAARVYQEVYYSFPTSSEAERAGEALKQLESAPGANLPRVSDDAATARAQALFQAGRFSEALGEYDALLAARPGSPWLGRWKVARARCLLRLHRTSEALDALRETTFTDPNLEAERLAAMVEAYAQQQDQSAMLGILNQLAGRFPQSSSYAAALYRAGNFFAGQQDWESALRYYQPLADDFPQDDRSLGAQWRVAYTYYLEKQNDKAREALLGHIERYPDSPRVPNALYWLGRLEEQAGEASQAVALYEFLRKRFVHSYYSLLAGRRLGTLATRRASSRDAQASADSPLAAVTKAVPPLDPIPESLCSASAAQEASHAASILKALNLAELAESYLRAAMSERQSAPSLGLALSQIEAEQGKAALALLDARRLVSDPPQYDFSVLPRELWDLLYPRAYWKLVTQQAHANKLDPYLVMGLIRQESAFNPKATSRVNARGLMQVMPSTASPSRRGRSHVAQRLYDPVYNVRFGCRYLRQVLTKFNGNVEATLAAYNAGDYRVKDWLSKRPYHEPAEFLETIPFGDTRLYVEDVIRDGEIYRQLMTGKPKFKKCG